MSEANNRSDPVTAGMPGGSRVLWAATLLLIVHAALCWVGRPPGIATRQDDSAYVLLAESLKQGGYEEIWHTDAAPQRRYPPVYPAALAVWGVVFGNGYDALVVLSILCSVAALAISFAVVRRTFTPAIAVASLAVLAVNPLVVQFGGSIATEAPFSALLVLAVGLLARPDVSRARAGVVGAAAIAAALTRVAAIPIVIAVGLFWALERRWKRLGLFAAATLATVGVWLVWSAAGPQRLVGRSYFMDLAAPEGWQAGPWSILLRFGRKVPFYLGRGIPYALATPTVSDTQVDNMIAAGIVAISLLIGVVVLLKRWRAAGLALLAYACMLVVWPWSNERFLVPVMVLIVPSALAGIAWLGRLRGPRTELAIVAITAVALTAAGAGKTASAARLMLQCDRSGPMPPAACVKRDQGSYFAALDYIVKNTPEDAIFINLKPEPFYLYTGRKTLGVLSVTEEPGAFANAARAAGASYVLLGSLQAGEPRRLALQLEASCSSLEFVEFFPARTYLFRIGSEVPEAVGQRACEAISRYRIANANRDFGRDP